MTMKKFFILFLLSFIVCCVSAVQKRFIFRQDDVQDWWLNTVQADMLNWFMDHNVGVSAGIIGNILSGDDQIIMDVLNRCVSLGYDKCALWNHNYDHDFHFATATSVAQAQAQVAQGDQVIRNLFPGYVPFLMCPPYNEWNNYLLVALKNLGYKMISASTIDTPSMTWNYRTNPIQMPQQTQTADWDNNLNDFVRHPIADTVAECEAAAAAGQVCVIMTHPTEFANGQYSLTMLGQLVNQLYAAGFTSTNFYTVMNEVLGSTSSPSAAPTKTPTKAPTIAPSKVPTKAPTAAPSKTPTQAPTVGATTAQTASQTTTPTVAVTKAPTTAPTVAVTTAQSAAPTTAQTATASLAPSVTQSTKPSASPTTKASSTPTAGQVFPITTNSQCGAANGKMCDPSSSEPCCSQYGWCGKSAAYCSTGCQSPYGLCNMLPTRSPTRAPTAAPTAGHTTQYSVVLDVKSGGSSSQFTAANQQTLLNTLQYFETGQNLISATYSGVSQDISATEFNVIVVLTYAINSVSSAAAVYSTTSSLLVTALSTTQFSDVYHSLGADQTSSFSLVQVSPNTVNGEKGYKAPSSSTASNSPLEPKSIGMIAAGGFLVILLVSVASYYYYQRRLRKIDENERIKSFRTESSEELIEGHYSLPKSDEVSVEYVEMNMILRHGMKMEIDEEQGGAISVPANVQPSPV